MEEKLKTKFASPDRSTQEEVLSSATLIASQDFFAEALNAFPDVVLVLNKDRQIIYANKILLDLLKITNQSSILGKRPGEVFKCIYSDKEEAGCGTSEFCSECGAVKSIVTAQNGEQNSQECHMTVKTENGDAPLDFHVRSVLIEVEDQSFVVVTIKEKTVLNVREEILN